MSSSISDMVCAILDKRKTVTRRVIKPQPKEHQKYPLGTGFAGEKKEDLEKFVFGDNMHGGHIVRCKFPYRIGDILYVRESYCPNYFDDFSPAYKANYFNGFTEVAEPKWIPSIHMPKEIARIFLKVTDVRVERLQDITVEQCQKEGVSDDLAYGCNGWSPSFGDPDSGGHPEWIKAFEYLWNSTLDKHKIDRLGWNANPWVFVIEFERCEK